MSDYTLGKIEFERHADAVMTSLADSVVRHMAELEEANARIAVLEEEQKVLKRERDDALAAVTEGGTGNPGVERPEPSPHFSEQSNLRSQAVTTCDQIVNFLRTYNRWRRGDETLEQPCPQEIGEAIDAACNEIERLERERDEERVITFRQADCIEELERERDEARAALLWAVEWLDTITGRFPEDGSVNEMFAELAKDRLTNTALDATWNEVGWTQAVAKEVRG
jgi:uncharacterized small protein (DUF1192 family)